MKKTSFILLLLFVIFCSLQKASAQFLEVPRASQKAKIYQRIGLTDMKIVYHRPAVNEREIWGDLVPYNEGVPTPWRAGANENTIIYFSDDVVIEGKPLSAGTYGLHMIPSEDEWTIIFSRNHSSWGSFSYNPEEDALRITVSPEEAAMQEYLTFLFDKPQSDAVTVALHWEKLKIPFKVEVNVHAIALQSFRDQLRSMPGFTWQGWNAAANYCLQNEINYEEALEWAERSIAGGFGAKATFTNLQTKSKLLNKLGRTEEATEALDKAITLATMTELHFYGRSLINENKSQEALKIFKLNHKRNPDDKFTVLVGLARGYQAVGDKKNAVKYWDLAIKGAPETQKEFYKEILEKLQNES